MKYYAVKKGRSVGVFSSWDDCQRSVSGFSGAVYKSFSGMVEAEAWLYGNKEEEVSGTTLQAHSKYINGEYLLGIQIKLNGKRLGFFATCKGNYMGSLGGELLGILSGLSLLRQMQVADATVLYNYDGVKAWADGTWSCKSEEAQKYFGVVLNSGINLSFTKADKLTEVKALSKRALNFQRYINMDEILEGNISVQKFGRLD